MYVASGFHLDPSAAWAFVARHPFALLLSAQGSEIEATHLPVVARERGGARELLMHLARANRHWHALDGAPVTVVFEGAHGYVSPTWYAASDGVPTWNYSAVHARGTARLGTRDDVLEQMQRTAAAHEPAAADGTTWQLARLPAGLRDQLLAAIVPIVVSVEQLDGKAKLSQNRSAADVNGVLAALEARGDAAALALAADMRIENAAARREP